MCVAPFAGSSAGGYPSRASGGAVRARARRAVRRAPAGRGCRSGPRAARGVPGGDDRAEVLCVERAGLPFGERGGRSRLDPDPGFAVGAVEDVGAVPGGRHPGIDDRLWRGQPHRAPRDVLADHIPVLRVGDVAARAHPLERRFAVGCDVGEVVLVGHVAAVPLRGVRELRVGRERPLAVAFAFLIDQAHHRGAHLFDIAGRGGQVGVGTGAVGECRARAADEARRDRAQTGCECEQRCESGVGHGDCIDARARGREPGRAGLDTFVGAPRAGSGCTAGRPAANHLSAGPRWRDRHASRGAGGRRAAGCGAGAMACTRNAHREDVGGSGSALDQA